MYTTRLTSADSYNSSNIIFSKPETASIPNSVISFKRIRIGTKYDDGRTGDLILKTPELLFSFGLQENKDPTTQKVNGYVVPICLWNKNGATEEEMKFTKVFEQIVDDCKKHVLENRDAIEKYELEASDLKNMSPLYWKKEKGKIVEGVGPVLYSKLMMGKRNETISTVFINADTNEDMDPFDIMNKYCFVCGAIKFESIYIGTKISLQVKLYEVLVKKMETERRTLLVSNVSRRVESVESKQAETDNKVSVSDVTEASDIFEAMQNPDASASGNASNAKTTGSICSDSSEGEDDDGSDEDEDEDEDDDVARVIQPAALLTKKKGMDVVSDKAQQQPQDPVATKTDTVAKKPVAAKKSAPASSKKK